MAFNHPFHDRQCGDCHYLNPTSGYCPKKGYNRNSDDGACRCFSDIRLFDGSSKVKPKDATAAAAAKVKPSKAANKNPKKSK